jgi:hypothetical protein
VEHTSFWYGNLFRGLVRKMAFAGRVFITLPLFPVMFIFTSVRKEGRFRGCW